MIDDGLDVRLVEAGSQVGLSHSQANGIADALAQGTYSMRAQRDDVRGTQHTQDMLSSNKGLLLTSHHHPIPINQQPALIYKVSSLTGGHLHTVSEEVLGVARGLAVPLAEVLDVFQL